MKVQTIKGLQDVESLRIVDVVQWGDNHRTVITQWWDGEELVKQDAAVSLLRGPEVESTQGSLG